MGLVGWDLTSWMASDAMALGFGVRFGVRF